MEILIFAIIFFAFLAPLVLAIVLPVYKNHNKATGGVINYDFFMRKFVFKVNLSKEDIINRLSSTRSADDLICTVDLENSVIKIAENGSGTNYRFQIREDIGFSVLKLEQTGLLGGQNNVPYKLNPFMVNKLQAEIIPFSEHTF